MKCFVHIGKMVVALLTCGVLLLFGALFAANGMGVLAACCILLGLLYAVIAVRNGARVSVGEEAVSRRTLGIQGKTLAWAEVKEVGVVGTKLFRPGQGKHTGTKYIYISQREMTEEERFDMCLEWPPKDMLFFQYRLKRIHFIQRVWPGRIELYNTGDLLF